MSKLIVSGDKKVCGEIEISSAKNVILPLISACIMIEGKITFLNCKKLCDVTVILEIIKYLGGEYSFVGDNLVVDCSKVYRYELPEVLSKKIRASIFLVGPLLSRFHRACFFTPGGCDIGSRPIDIHLDGFKKLGVEIASHDVIYCRTNKLVGNEIVLRYRSVGATENIIMASVMADGKTVIRNSAKEPEIVCLVKFLKLCGAKIYGEGTSTITIEGVKKLKASNLVFKPISDRIEVGSYILLTLSVGGEILLKNANFLNNIALYKKIRNNACKITLDNDKIYIKASGVGKGLNYIKTAPYPYFPTDLQSQLCAYSTTLKGLTVVEESVFENRFMQLNELNKMGANIVVKGNKAFVKGVDRLVGTSVVALDLRGGMAMVIAGLKADGITTISNCEIIDRGYYKIENQLSSLGLDVVRSNLWNIKNFYYL